MNNARLYPTISSSTAAVAVHPGIWRLRFGTPETMSPVDLRETPVAESALARMPVGALPFDVAQIRCTTSERGCLIELPLDATEALYGLGLQLKSHNQRGLKKTLRVNSDPIADLGDAHAPVPFYLSTNGYGVLVDTARYASFYGGGFMPADCVEDETTAAATAIANNTTDLYRAAGQHRHRMAVEVPVAQGVDVYIFSGPQLKDALRRYVLFSGGGCLPPQWSLGVWYRVCGNDTAADVLRVADELRDKHMPCDVLGLEPGWQSRAYPCSFVWNPERFPEPQRLIDGLIARGLHVNCWEHAFTHPDSPIFQALKPHCGDLAVFRGIMPDFAIPEARRIFSDHHQRAFVDAGVTGFKLDECDNSDYISHPWSFPEFARFPSGLDGERMHSLFGLLYQRTMDGLMRASGVRTLQQVRCSHALAAPYPFVLYSDLYDHRDFVRGLVNAGFTGLLWSPEVRQCASVEELVRRVQSVVFSPQALINAWMIPHPPWKQVDEVKNRAHEFMPEEDQATTLVRDLFRLRMRFIPYLYSAFARYRDDGVPPVRALVVEHPHDAETHRIDDQYYFGDDLIVAPIFAGQTRRRVYLPEGRWHHFFTGVVHSGKNWYEVDAPLEQMPIFVRDGALLPLAEPMEQVANDAVFRITVLVYGDQSRPVQLFEDDGHSFAFEQGHSNRLTLGWNKIDGGSVQRDGVWRGRRYDIVDWQHIP